MLDRQKVYLITSNAEAGTMESLPATEYLEIISSEDLLQTNLRFLKLDKVCIDSESSITAVVSRIDDPDRKLAIEILKNKYTFRKIIANLYPNYQYQFVNTRDIQHLRITQKSVIKPIKGVFGTAVRTIDRQTNLTNLSSELTAELSKNESIFSDGVLSKEEFIVEQYIEGEEYAVDMFYNQIGEPCITNIYHHPMPQNKAYLHMIYYSSKQVFDKIYEKAKYLFTSLNQILNVTNIAIHGEFKFHSDELVPIEMNVLRFGGMGLGNMAFHSLGINPYSCFLNGTEPDWQRIWQDKSEDIFTFFIAYNGVNRDPLQYQPKIDLLKQQFTEILREQSFDHQKQLTFGIYYLKETQANISNLLKIEFDDFFEKIL